ncbi:cell fate regulator YaaT (PSP1 superfamily) [Bacilli bacterium PM5-3]|nr:cell fate regulator YaaT (PSP1 superfamily) [Bacilli bacterium PM5-3]MDH6603679.1 cell fate regulator YaaT (PSP1 superfamily) [Bacilli bacterium PM5-9]
MRVVSVVFKEHGKEYYFKCDDDIKVKVNNKVVVDTSRGIELAYVVQTDVKNVNIPEADLMPVVRHANKRDLKNYEENFEKAKQGAILFNKILADFPDLEMSLVSCEYNLDQSKILFMYVSDDRVDFRELLKVLAGQFKKRIELKQIGARDKAKIIGGLGPCGMETCCSRYLKDFDNISINMAKNQMLSLNPTKISGLCGRLLCCLKYENDAYTKEKEHYPKIGSHLKYEKDEYKVVGLSLLTNQVKIEREGVIKMVDKDELKW